MYSKKLITFLSHVLEGNRARMWYSGLLIATCLAELSFRQQCPIPEKRDFLMGAEVKKAKGWSKESPSLCE